MRANAQRFLFQIRRQLSPVERRERELWILILTMAGILFAGFFAVTFPAAFLDLRTSYNPAAPQLLLGLLTLVLLFGVYLVHKCIQIRTLRFNSIMAAWQSEVADIQLFTDPLTRVFNRSALDGILSHVVERVQRKQATLVFLYIDINNFKQINTYFGHRYGDLVLSEVGGMIKQWIRSSDCVIRLGGDEFLVALLNTNQPGGELVKGRIHQWITDWNEIIAAEENSPLPGFQLSLSIGIHEFDGTQSIDQALEEASSNMEAERTHYRLRQMAPVSSGRQTLQIEAPLKVTSLRGGDWGPFLPGSGESWRVIHPRLAEDR
ncbi:MAG: GGDEF domain-containing protein [Acidobacteria bacterium]|nr:GGDEF domain-containing protein [Acidobacteriota bacterium]